MTVTVNIHSGTKTEEEFKAAVEKYVRSWIFEKGHNYENKNPSQTDAQNS